MKPWRVGAAALCVVVTGCRHKVVPTVLPPPIVVTTVPLEKPPEPATPPEVAQVPVQEAPLPEMKVPAKKVKKIKKKVPPSTPLEVASAGPPPAPGSVIGALTAGGDATPARKQKAADLLAELDKRLGTLSAALLEAQKEGLTRVRYFEHEARTALDSGDTDGAEVLVTKAKLLLDDLVK